MAKRYYAFSDLNGSSGEYKPGGTLGKHNCIVVPQGDRIVVIGSVSGRVTLREGDTLGYDCGTVWLVPRPESYRDPIRRVLALAKISQKVLEFSDAPVRYSVSYGRSLPNSAADTERGESIRAVLGEHKRQEVPDTYSKSPDEGDYNGAFGFQDEVVGGDCIIIQSVATFEATTSSRGRRVSRVVVRTKANKAKVAAWLEEELTPEGQDRRRTREAAEEADRQAKDAADLEAAQKLWDQVTYSYRSPSYYYDTFKFDRGHGEETFNLQTAPGWARESWSTGSFEKGAITLLEAYRCGLLTAWAKARRPQLSELQAEKDHQTSDFFYRRVPLE